MRISVLIAWLKREWLKLLVMILSPSLFYKLCVESSWDIPTYQYTFHSQCNCSRKGPSLPFLLGRMEQDTSSWGRKGWDPEDGTFVGFSTCDLFTSALGAGQKVLSYSFYIPPDYKNPSGERRRPAETEERYTVLMQELLDTAKLLYPGWRIRIYHNVTQQDSGTLWKLCTLYCQYDHLDLCDVSAWQINIPYGEFWRFQALGDPTVRAFGSRDLDAVLSPREVSAVTGWLESGRQFHVMRDGPFHGTVIPAGLWGASNYNNMDKAHQLKKRMWQAIWDIEEGRGISKADKMKLLSRNFYGLDRIVLRVVWPEVKQDAVIHDSYHCNQPAKYGHTTPWPTRRLGWKYVGYGPLKDYATRLIQEKRCPVQCRPKDHQDWMYC